MSIIQSILNFVGSHNEAILAGAGVAVLDAIFAFKSSWASNGILHWVYITLKGQANKPQA